MSAKIGYAIFDKNKQKYLDSDGMQPHEDRDVEIYKDKKELIEGLDEMGSSISYLSSLEVHKVKVSFEVEDKFLLEIMLIPKGKNK